MKKKSIEILCLIDRSGSMSHMHSDSIGAFNAFLKEQKKAGVKGRVTLAVFDDQYELLRDRVKVDQCPALAIKECPIRGTTALNDAMGKLLSNAKPDKPTICQIMTDGQENASQEYSTEQVKALVKEREEAGWKFTFHGVGVDAFETGGQYGMAADAYQNFTNTKSGHASRSRGMVADTLSYSDHVNQKTAE